MQSSEDENSTDNGGKSRSEWPSLNDVYINDRPSQATSSSNNEKNHQKRNKSCVNKSGGYDSSKETDVDSPSTSSRGARKKASSKVKWVQVPIESQPYKKRGNGRRYFHSNKPKYAENKNESNGNTNLSDENKNESNENTSLSAFERGHNRGDTQYRGRRGRGYSNWRPRREESTKGVENASSNIPYEDECYYNSAYYDPVYYSMCATALRDKELQEAIKHQIEYYFSDDNLVKDIFIRRKMDSQGYVPLTLIATFHRVRNLTKNMDIIIEAVKDSSKLELVDDAKVRPVVDPLKWPLQDTFVGLRTDVPEFIPGQPYMHAIVTAIENMNFSVDVNTDNFSETPDSASLSPNVCSELAIQYFPENGTPPEHMNGDTYSNTCSDELANGYNFYNEQVSNDMLYFKSVNNNEKISNGVSFDYGSSPDEVLSSETDNSAEDHQTVLDAKSPTPSL